MRWEDHRRAHRCQGRSAKRAIRSHAMNRTTCVFAAALACVAAPALAQTPAPVQRWPVHVIIITTYEEGADTGDRPGELQLWAERQGLTERVDFPGGMHPLLTNRDHTVVAMVSGIGLVNAGASVMALAADPRFDVRRAYWLLAGIAGVDPAAGAIGDAAWADYVVGDFAKSMDAREMPADWPYGIYPFRAAKAGTMPAQKLTYGAFDRYAEVYPLNPGLTRWAYDLTRDVKLDYTPAMAAFGAQWVGYPRAAMAPRVEIASSFASNHFWHGKAPTQWARDWVRMFTEGKASFTMTDTEDSAVAEAMARLNAMGAADGNRLMILRTASNFSMPHEGQTTIQSVNAPFPFGGVPAFEAAFRVGSKVVNEIDTHWSRYADHVPGAG